MTPTTNTPTLLSCLRAIAESGKTQRVQFINGNVSVKFHSDSWITVDWFTPVGLIQELCLNHALIQIAKEIPDKDLKILLMESEKESGVNFGWKEQVKRGSGFRNLTFWIGKDGITSMAHALAFGLCVALEIEVKE